MSKSATLVSLPSTDEGTFGTFATDDGEVICRTGELPYRNNCNGVSCVDADTYTVRWLWSEKHKRKCYHLEDKHGRSSVEIHSANFMGDKSKGFKAELLGCIAPGLHVTTLQWKDDDGIPHNQTGVSESRAALEKIEVWGNGEDFTLKIIRN